MRIALPKFSRSVSKSYGCIVILRIMYFNMMVHTGFEPVKRCPFKVLALQCHLTLMPQIKYDALPRVLLLYRIDPAFLAVRGLDTAYCYYSPRKGSLTTELFAINSCR